MKLYEPAPPARKDELANVQDGIAVIVDGDTCPVVVESGMYAYIKNNTHGLAEGLYKNISDSTFPTSGGTADGTVFEADSTGGLNALNASLPFSKMHKYEVEIPWQSISANSVVQVTLENLSIPDNYIPLCAALLATGGDVTIGPINAYGRKNGIYEFTRIANFYTQAKNVSGTLYMYFIEP